VPETPDGDAQESRARTAAEGLPVNTSVEGVHAEPRKSGHRLLDLSIAISAIVISLVSLTVGIHHGRVQQELVAANSWPFLTWRPSTDLGGGHPTFSMAILNSGVGPAVLEKLVVRYKGEPVRGWLELLQACCGVSRSITPNELQNIGFESGGAPKSIIRANESVLLLRLGRLPERPEIWERLSAARLELTFEACYCSILGDCWDSDLQSLHPSPVEQCTATPDDYVEVGAGLDDAKLHPVMQGIQEGHDDQSP
jgi:hypothetical protein